jgi:hypothetical protein
MPLKHFVAYDMSLCQSLMKKSSCDATKAKNARLLGPEYPTKLGTVASYALVLVTCINFPDEL